MDRATRGPGPYQVILACLVVLFLQVGARSAFAKKSAPASPVDTRYEDALQLFQAGQGAAAIYMLQQIVKDDPSKADVYKKMAEMAVAGKNWAYAIQTLAKAAQLRPDDIVVRRVLMAIFAAYQMPMEELLCGREVLAREPRNKELITRLAFLCHDQNLVEDEAQLRARLADIEPDNYENYRLVAQLYAVNGKNDEEINVLRTILKKWPEKREHRIRLAAVYGSVEDRFSQVEALRALPDRRTNPVARSMTKEAIRHLRRDRKLLDQYEPTWRLEREQSREFKLRREHSESQWMHPSLSKDHDRGVWSRYEHLDYKGINVLAGEAKIDSYDFMLRQVSWWDRERFRLTLGLGATHVGVRSAFFSRFGTVLTPTDYPFLEATGFGGTTPIASVKLERRVGNRCHVSGWVDREVMADLDAHVRMVRRTVGGVGGDYVWPDSTLVHLQYEVSDITDSNTGRNGKFWVSRTFLGKGPEHNYAGHRQGFFVSPPSSFVALKYQAEYIDHDHRSRLYQTYSDEVDQELSLSAELKLPRKMFLKAEAFYALGNRVLVRKSSGTLGLGWRNMDDGNDLVLQYAQARDTVADGTQINQTFLGDSRFEQFQLAGRWHF